MIAPTNEERLEQEIANLIHLISKGKKFFFKVTNNPLHSSDIFLNHFECKEVFAKYTQLRQLELNIQLLYIKLSSYYTLLSDMKLKGLKRSRNAFAHELTNLIFNKRVNYNFFLHKVTKRLKKIQYIFYQEDAKLPNQSPLIKTLDLNLDSDINDFLKTWNKRKNQRF